MRVLLWVMIAPAAPEMKTYIVVPKMGEALRVKAQKVVMSLVNHSVHLCNGKDTVALFDTEKIIGVIEESALGETPRRESVEERMLD